MIKETYITRVKETSLNISQTKVESIRKKDITRTGIRVYKDGYIGFAGALGDVDEKELEKEAISILDEKIEYPYDVCKNLVVNEEYESEIIKDEEIISEFDEVFKTLEKQHPEFTFFDKVNIVECKKQLSNSEGLDLKYSDKYIEICLCVKAKQSINILDNVIEIRTKNYNREALLNTIDSICIAYKNKVELEKEGKMIVVFSSNEYMYKYQFIKELNGNLYGSKSVLLSDKLGKKVFNENLTIYQCNNPKYYPGSFFDAQGVINEGYEYALIENGVFVAPYTDKKTADKYNLDLTGAASCEYDGMPMLGMPELRFKEGEKTIKELLKGQKAIFIQLAMGGDFTSDGSFATPVQVAYLFDGEKFIGRLPELKISSSFFDMYGKDFIGVSKDTINPIGNDRYVAVNMDVSKL